MAPYVGAPEIKARRLVLAVEYHGQIGNPGLKAAAKSGVNARTLRRWLADDAAFKADYAMARQTAFEAGMNRVQALMVRAVDTLTDLLDAKTQPNVRLGAARTVAELGMHRHDADTILRKLAEIETAQRQQGTTGTS